MDLDTRLPPEPVFRQFADLLVAFASEWAPQLQLTREFVHSNYDAIPKLAPSLELLSEPVLGNPTIKKAAQPLGELIGRIKDRERAALKLVTVDVLVFGSLIPVLLDAAPRTCALTITLRAPHSNTPSFRFNRPVLFALPVPARDFAFRHQANLSFALRGHLD